MDLLLYVSTSRLDAGTSEEGVAGIVAESRRRNEARGLTGALMFTGTYFAQILEGASDELDRLLISLRRDDRHADLQVIARQPLPERRFAEWSMAYSGPSQFITRQVHRVMTDPSPQELRRAADWLSDVMREFVSR
jgi:hypothetical protein